MPHKFFKSAIVVIIFVGVLATPFVFAAGPSASLFTKSLRFGSENEEVKNLQALLRFIPDIYPEGIVSGYYGRLTQAAVQRFQTKYGLPPVGVVGPLTRAKLNQVATRIVNPAETAVPAPPQTAGAAPPVVSPSTSLGTGRVEPQTAGVPPPPPPVTPPIPAPTPSTTPTPTVPYFRYSWTATSTLTGEVRLPIPAPRPVYILDGKPTIILQTSAAVRLADLYKVILVDDEEKWDDLTSGMLLEMIERLPSTPFGRSGAGPWKMLLTKVPVSNDVEVKTDGAIRIYKEAFARSNPTLQPSAEGNQPRVFYSNRLFRAILETFYNEKYLLEEVVQKRYGFKLGLGEPVDEFQQFSLDEMQYLAGVIEDLPSGFWNIRGLEKIVRRKLGLTNPYQPGACAIAQISVNYMEFMDCAFSAGNAEYTQRLIAHEFTHFLWHNILTPETQKKFADLSGWTAVQNNKWIRNTTTNFVSSYAAAFNPDEDFAETVSYYIYQPDLVRTMAPDKYSFVKDVVSGYEYVVLAEKQFTFQVFNLEPDVTFPGKIMGVDIEVYKTENGDNRIVADLRLSPKFGDGAEQAVTRIFSPAGTYLDVYFSPVNGNKFLLRADFTINKYAAQGYWMPDQITVRDKVDNRRYEGQKQFGWLMYINNPDEDLEAPIADIYKIKAELIEVGGESTIRVTVPVTDKNEVGLGGYATVNQYASGQQTYDYADYDSATKQLVYLFSIRKYNARGAWTFREFSVSDIAGNQRRYDLKLDGKTVNVLTSNPDYEKPTLDVSAIKIEAVPLHPEAPDGATDVTIWYKAWDDNSGLGGVNYTILKPNGQSLFDYHYHDNFYTPYFVGDPREPKLYKIQLRLPQGSPPGTWVLREISLHDKAGNILTSNFVEIGIVKPFKVL